MLDLGSSKKKQQGSEKRKIQILGLAFLFLSAKIILTVTSSINPQLSLKPETMASLSSSINTFGTDLFDCLSSQASAKGPGTFLSPYGIVQALGMLFNGVKSGSKSYQQLLAAVFTAGSSEQALGLDDLNSQLLQISEDITKSSNGDSLIVSDANSIWLEKQLTLQQHYKAHIEKTFAAQLEPITTAQVVNSWVREATRGKITSIIDDDTLQQCTCVIINALYFKGLWKSQFNKAETGPVSFNYLKGGTDDVSMMYKAFDANSTDIQVARFSGALAGGGQVPCIAVQLPYEGGDFAAVLAMPDGELSTGSAGSPLQLEGGVDYGAALAGCRAALLKGLGNGQQSGLAWATPGMKAKLWMPRFEIEFSTSLSKALQQLGITAPFQSGDITGIASAPDGSPILDLQVDEVIHKVYIKVDEAGTEAAAVTAIMMVRSAMMRPPSYLQLKFDRPFAFAVVHRVSNTALFMGEVMEPESWAGVE